MGEKLDFLVICRGSHISHYFAMSVKCAMAFVQASDKRQNSGVK